MKIFNNDTVAEMIDEELILIDFESIETEFKYPDMVENLKEFEALPDEKKIIWFEEYKENFLMHHDPEEWDQFYEEAKAVFQNGGNEIEIELIGQEEYEDDELEM